MSPGNCGLILLLLSILPWSGSAQEFRALWADTFHAGMRNSSEVSALVAATRSANCNAIVVEVRKRGDAYYRNGLEPVATGVAAGFDPLADLIQKAHTGTPRIEVHAWLVAYNIWNDVDDAPPQATHPYNLHPDWLTQRNDGELWDGGNYQFDQGHPAVQKHTFDVCMDILNRYDIDGLHFDYIRYTSANATANNQPWGYNPVTVERFNRLKIRTGTPSPTSNTWLQWRRDQVTALVRKVYLSAWAAKPHVRVSAALIPWSSPPANLDLSTWKNTEAYARVLQDWRGWMEEGILDLACPMIYRNQDTTAGFDAWADFAKDRQYNRAAAIGMGWYLNSIGNTIDQVKEARTASPGGKFASGVVGYSYAVPNKDAVSQSTTWQAFTDDATAETYDPGGTPVFPSNVTTPAMPWKTSTTKGHTMGFAKSGATAFDGVTVTLTGPQNRTLLSDATGWFGTVDLPVGNYTLSFNVPGYRPVSKTFSVTGGSVAQPAILVERVPLLVTTVTRNAAGDMVTITWNSIPGRIYSVQGSTNLQQWSSLETGIIATAVTTTQTFSLPPAWQAQTFLRVVEQQ